MSQKPPKKIKVNVRLMESIEDIDPNKWMDGWDDETISTPVRNSKERYIHEDQYNKVLGLLKEAYKANQRLNGVPPLGWHKEVEEVLRDERDSGI
jgi:hypothetical protein